MNILRVQQRQHTFGIQSPGGGHWPPAPLTCEAIPATSQAACRANESRDHRKPGSGREREKPSADCRWPLFLYGKNFDPELSSPVALIIIAKFYIFNQSAITLVFAFASRSKRTGIAHWLSDDPELLATALTNVHLLQQSPRVTAYVLPGARSECSH
ncbi:hypothetical protein EVAR_62380_1 [Eumeta japonica]|uniref:Uncharacterized protein n=1 Tax=Eumeta variegata TaxID=151549 RepID=A0A4C1Z010_EUMVA|nr:hypothetical protein EVAR_62380_1 [Eumeta japonica]